MSWVYLRITKANLAGVERKGTCDRSHGPYHMRAVVKDPMRGYVHSTWQS